MQLPSKHVGHAQECHVCMSDSRKVRWHVRQLLHPPPKLRLSLPPPLLLLLHVVLQLLLTLLLPPLLPPLLLLL